MIEDSQTLRRGFRANQNLIVLHWSFSLSCGLIFLIVCSNAGVGCTFRRCRETAPRSPRKRVFKPLCCFPATMALSGYKGCTERIFTLYLLNSKYALESMLQAKKVWPKNIPRYPPP